MYTKDSIVLATQCSRNNMENPFFVLDVFLLEILVFHFSGSDAKKSE